MYSQSWLLLVAIIATLSIATSVPNSIQDDDDDKLPMAFNPKFNKMFPQEKLTTKTAPPTSEKKLTTKIPLADDPRFNKMLPETNMLKDESTESSKKDYSGDDYYYENYDYDYYPDDDDNNKTKTIKPLSENKLKLIKGDDKNKPIKNEDDKKDNTLTEDDIEDANDEDDEDDDDTDIGDEEEIVFNENVPCPRDCICSRNINSYLVATCSRLDADIQKFGSDITDLVVVDVGPKYPILLGPNFFVKIGLKHISSIKIANCTVEYIHPTAFHGLTDLFSVNLTNIGITMLNPDTFALNTHLRLLTIAGNDLTFMTHRDSVFKHYMLKAPSVEEIDLSNNNLQELLPTAFDELSNVVYINLAQNSLKTLPESIFNNVETIEELDLSFNSITNLPEKLFNRTALAILHLKYNEISNDLKFVTSDLQQLDLSYCSIKHVTNHMFTKMEGLTTLNLKGNMIKKIQPEAFLSLKNLRHIDLSFNNLDQVSALLFYKNSDLDVIRLNDNPELSQLPTDGFQSHSGEFNVYLFDVSNCAIGALGHNTFSTMPQLTTLKMGWNNINNLDKGTFVYLNKLIDLDLSNNLIVRIDDLTFLHNRELSKLNLAGNPIKKLSAKLFLPIRNLKELDVSECELHTLLINNSDNYKIRFYDSLRIFNASFNQIKKISIDDIKPFKNMKTLDILNNPLKCNDEFRDLMKWLGKKSITTGKIVEMMNLDDSFTTIANRTIQTWDDLARSVCKRAAEQFKPRENIIKDLIKSTTTTKTTTTAPKDIRNNDIINIDKNDFNKDENQNNNAEEVGDDENSENDSEYDDEDEDDYDDDENNDESDIDDNKPLIADKGLFAEEVNIIQETEDKILRGKLGNDDSDVDNEVIIEHGRIYYSGYHFLWPVLIIVSSVIVLLLVIAKTVSLLMRRRGERYRQALLASKNSIVYQKLSEEIGVPQTPKIHRYEPINQV